MLPVNKTRPEDTVAVTGGEVVVRSLTVQQAMKLAEFTDNETRLKALVEWSTGADHEEVANFFENGFPGDVLAVVNAALRVSGLDNEARFQG